MKFRVHNKKENILEYPNENSTYLLNQNGGLHKLDGNGMFGLNRFLSLDDQDYEIQYETKFTDTNNKIIYEGDILRHSKLMNAGIQFVGEGGELWKMIVWECSPYLSVSTLECDTFEIIGNIVENPEMLDIVNYNQ